MSNIYDYLGNRIDITAGGGIFLNVVDAGIDNTGAIDVSAAINDLIKNGGRYFFPKGLYLLNGQMVVPSNTIILGEGDETVFKASSTLDAVYNTICNRNAQSINARLCRNVASDGYPGTAEYITEYDHDITLLNFKVDGNWSGRDLVNWNKYYTGHGTQITREPGTNLEIQAAHNVVIDGVTAINGIQHNINVRAGAFSYNQGIDYECVFPSYDVVISNCIANNERYDDCITTHDSYNILIDNCTCTMDNNANGTYSSAVSNGIEIDDGSRYVEVRNCKVYYAFCGFQAKGHSNTPPAHDVTFRNCQAYYTQFGFTASCGPESAYSGRDTIAGRCRNILIVDCSVIQPYAFSNITSWLGSLVFVSLLNTLNVVIQNFYVENSGAPAGVQNDYGAPLRTMAINLRESCYDTVVKGMKVTHQITNTYASGGLFLIPANSGDVIIKDVLLSGFTGNPIIRASANAATKYLLIDGIFTPRIASGDYMLQVASVSDPSQILLKGTRINMEYLS